jgi:hypothetical protein
VCCIIIHRVKNSLNPSIVPSSIVSGRRNFPSWLFKRLKVTHPFDWAIVSRRRRRHRLRFDLSWSQVYGTVQKTYPSRDSTRTITAYPTYSSIESPCPPPVAPTSNNYRYTRENHNCASTCARFVRARASLYRRGILTMDGLVQYTIDRSAICNNNKP